MLLIGRWMVGHFFCFFANSGYRVDNAEEQCLFFLFSFSCPNVTNRAELEHKLALKLILVKARNPTGAVRWVRPHRLSFYDAPKLAQPPWTLAITAAGD